MNHSPARGILMAVMSGIGAAAMNFGVAFGGPVVDAAAAHGANPAWRMNAVWLPLMATGAVPNLFYCGYLMRSKRTSGNFSMNGTGRYWLFASLMATFWFASTLMYGIASSKLGALGPVYGWPFFMSLIVIVSSVIGILAGEWKHATKSAVRGSRCADNGGDYAVLRRTSSVGSEDEGDRGRSRRYTRYRCSG
jgi:L-rhamnose-H+ transport protein